MLSINCPPGPVAPGSDVSVTGSTSDCENTEASVTVDGNDVPFTWTCDDGAFTIKAKAPVCDSGSSNVMVFDVQLGTENASCSVEVDCD